MITSTHKLIATLATAAVLLITSAAMAKAPNGGRPGQNGNTTGKGSTTTTLSQNNIARGEQKEQHLQAERKFREANLERARQKEQMLKDKNAGGGFTITHGGGKLPNEPGNNADGGFTITHGGGKLPNEPGNNPDGGFTITHGGGKLPNEPGNNPDKGWDHDCGKQYCYDHHDSSCYSECSYVCSEPLNGYVVVPGDTFETISMKFFGVSTGSANIAMFNHMPIDAALTPGETLMLPSMSKTL